MNNEILQKIDEINDEIENSLIFKKYLDLKKRIANNKELVLLINKVRISQKDYAHHLILKKELDSITNELNNYPLYREYNNTLAEINNIYIIIENRLNSYFQSKMNDK